MLSEEQRTAAVDRFLDKAISRKLTAWLVGTIMILTSHLDAENWMYLTMVYIGSQGAVDAVKALKGK